MRALVLWGVLRRRLDVSIYLCNFEPYCVICNFLGVKAFKLQQFVVVKPADFITFSAFAFEHDVGKLQLLLVAEIHYKPLELILYSVSLKIINELPDSFQKNFSFSTSHH